MVGRTCDSHHRIYVMASAMSFRHCEHLCLMVGCAAVRAQFKKLASPSTVEDVNYQMDIISPPSSIG